MTRPTTQQAVALINDIFGLDWAGAFIEPGHVEITMLERTMDELTEQIEEWKAALGITDGVEIEDDKLETECGGIDCVTIRIRTEERVIQ